MPLFRTNARRPRLRARLAAGVAAATLALISAGAASAAEVTLRFGHYFATEDFRGRTAQYLADRIQTLSKTIKVEVFPAESLVKGREGLQATAQGTVDMYSIYAGYITGQCATPIAPEAPSFTACFAALACVPNCSTTGLVDSGKLTHR